MFGVERKSVLSLLWGVLGWEGVSGHCQWYVHPAP